MPSLTHPRPGTAAERAPVPHPGRVLRAACIALLLGLLPAACGPVGPATFEGAVMGTRYRVLLARPPVDGRGVAAGIRQVLERVDRRMSTYKPESEVSRFNASRETGWFPVSAETARVVAKALEVWRESGGAFDITVAPLVDLWGFGPRLVPERVPSGAEIGAALARTGSRHLAVRPDPPALRKELPELEIDLSAIAKGYAVDAVAAWLEKRGFHDYLVELGGEVRVSGQRPGGRPWRVAVERGAQGRAGVLELTSGAVATSGDYRNWFELDGVRYSHEIDPRTGRPVGPGLVQVTVLAPTCMEADAWATALMVAGPREGPSLARHLGLQALFLHRRGEALEELTTGGLDLHRRDAEDAEKFRTWLE